jgi:adenylate kinase family enzyme
MQILIGGASGVAKSTQAIQICKNIHLVHQKNT